MSGSDKGYSHSKLVRINSAQAANSSTSLTDWIAELGTTCQQVGRVSFQSVVFNNNGYNINGQTSSDPNNEFWFQLQPSGSVYQRFIAEGFYDTSQLMTAVAAQVATLGLGQSITLTQDPISYKISLTYNPGTSGQTSFTIIANPPGRPRGSVWTSLGFAFNSVALSGVPIAATNLPALTGLRQVYLTSSNLSPSNQIDEKGDFQNVSVAIPVTAPFGAVNVWECKVDSLCQITYKTSRNIQRIDFQLRDEDGSVIDLHGSSVKVELRVWFNKAS